MIESKFKEVITLAATLPNDADLGKAIRELYWKWWKDTNTSTAANNQLKLFDVPVGENASAEDIADRGRD
tara:strand:- start:229 stop:438 length:210 start_codon:yes stop_codon:yes gene_type:complete